MSVVSVLSNLDFTNIEDSQRSQIEDAITFYYNSSNTARELLERISDYALKLEFRFDPDQGNGAVTAYDGHKIVFFNYAEIENTSFINSSGDIYAATIANVVMHELIHATALDGHPVLDNAASDYVTPGWDYVGDALRVEHVIYAEIGSPNVRVSYDAVIPTDQLASIGMSVGGNITGEFNIALAISDLKDQNAIETRDRADDVLLIGLDGDDHIHAGSGNDTIIGGDGNDVLAGGAGFDYIEGNGGEDTIVGGTITSFDDLLTVTDHAEWTDGAADYLVGGEGIDTYLLRGSSELAAGRLNQNFLTYQSWRDIISDSDFNAYVQFTVDGELNTALITSSMVSAGMSDAADDTLGTFMVNSDVGGIQATLRGGQINDFYVVWAEWYEGEMASALARFDYVA